MPAEMFARVTRFVSCASALAIVAHTAPAQMTMSPASDATALVYPDFFKVAVSSSGNHENDVYNLYWSEKHHGVKETVKGDSITFEYAIEKNSELARTLNGHLLLTTGDMDNNVHPANTFRMADALSKANKRFDFFVFPGQRHGYGTMSDYWFWLRAEYFVRHLLGDTRWAANISELDVERPPPGGAMMRRPAPDLLKLVGKRMSGR